MGTSVPHSQGWMQHIKDRQGHRNVFIKRKHLHDSMNVNPFYTLGQMLDGLSSNGFHSIKGYF